MNVLCMQTSRRWKWKLWKKYQLKNPERCLPILWELQRICPLPPWLADLYYRFPMAFQKLPSRCLSSCYANSSIATWRWSRMHSRILMLSPFFAPRHPSCLILAVKMSKYASIIFAWPFKNFPLDARAPATRTVPWQHGDGTVCVAGSWCFLLSSPLMLYIGGQNFEIRLLTCATTHFRSVCWPRCSKHIKVSTVHTGSSICSCSE